MPQNCNRDWLPVVDRCTTYADAFRDSPCEDAAEIILTLYDALDDALDLLEAEHLADGPDGDHYRAALARARGEAMFDSNLNFTAGEPLE